MKRRVRFQGTQVGEAFGPPEYRVSLHVSVKRKRRKHDGLVFIYYTNGRRLLRKCLDTPASVP